MVPLHGTCLFEVKAKRKPPESWRPFLHMRLAHLFCRDNETRGPSLNEKQKTHCSAAKEKLTAVQRRNVWNRQAIVLVFVSAIP
jgi:hypothetical protein